MTHSTKNAIELRCDPETLRNGIYYPLPQKMHFDACVAHALMKAIEEFYDLPMDEQRMDAWQALGWVRKRAAEILESEFGIKP